MVPWSVRLLQKPARLITRVIDRLRQWHLLKKLDKANIPAPIKAEMKADIQWSEKAQGDFSDALAECAAIELNKAQVTSVNQHWINLAITGGELAVAHFALAARIDELILLQSIAVNDRHNQPPAPSDKTA